MEMCQKIAVLGVFLALFIACNIPYVSAFDYEIDGNKVYVDNPKVYLSAQPHTIKTGDDTIYFELFSKLYEGDIDLAFGFDIDKIKPKGAFFLKNGRWVDVSSAFDVVEHEHGGMNRWYFAKDFNVFRNETYNLKINFRIMQSGIAGKYWVCAKPSSLSIAEAISQDKFLCLDPWYSIEYYYKLPVNASTTSGTVTMPVLINDTDGIDLGDGKQYIWCNYTVTNVRSVVGYLYYNDSSTYACINSAETSKVAMDIDQGNETDYGNPWANADAIYHLNDTLIFDSSGNGRNNFTMIGGKAKPGKVGYGLNFDGSGDYFSIDGIFDTETSGTVMAWINWTHNDEDWIITKIVDNNNYYRYLTIYSGLASFFSKTGGNNRVRCLTGKTYNDGDFHLYAVTFNSSSCRIYMDGANDTKETVYNTGATAVDFYTMIGKNPPTQAGNYDFNGDMDELRFYNYQLSPDEIMAIYNNTKGNQNFAPLGNPVFYKANLTFVIPTPLNTTRIVPYLFFNLTSDRDLDFCNLILDGTNQSMINSTERNFYKNVTGLSNGTYFFYASCNDTNGISENTSLWYVMINIPIPPPVIENISYVFDISKDLPIKRKYCNGNYLYVFRERTSCGSLGCQITNQTDITMCANGCEENLSIYGAECVPQAFDIFVMGWSLFIVSFVGLLFIVHKLKRKKRGSQRWL